MPTLSNAHALIVGIANYHYVSRLPSTVLNDAQAIYNLLIDPQHCAYAPENVTLLLDDQATHAALRQAFSALAIATNPDSTVFIYISSHGGRIETGPQAGEYLLPVDTRFDSTEIVAHTAISGAEFITLLSAIPARKVVVVFDCCYAAGIGQPKAVEEIEETRLPTRLSMLTTLNLVQPQRAEREFRRLIQALQGPLPTR